MFKISNELKKFDARTKLDEYMMSELFKISNTKPSKMFSVFSEILKLAKKVEPESSFAPKVNYSYYSNTDLQAIGQMFRITNSPDFNYKEVMDKEFKINEQDALFGQYASTLMNWNLTKRIYTINDDILSELISGNKNPSLPCDVLLQLPDYAVYVNCPIEFTNVKVGVSGFYATLTNNILFDGRVCPALQIIWGHVSTTENPKISSMVLLLDNTKDLNQAIAKTFSQAKEHLNSQDELSDSNNQLLAAFINCLLYLCQPEVDYKGGQPKCYVRNRVKLGMKIEPAKKITNVIVGEASGKQLREARVVAEREFKEGKRKSPHLRRGHFHHYWILDADNEGQAKLIVKWLNPIMVNGTI